MANKARPMVIILLSLAGVAIYCILAILILYIKGALLLTQMDKVELEGESPHIVQLDGRGGVYHLENDMFFKAVYFEGKLYLKNGEVRDADYWWYDNSLFIITIDGQDGYYKFCNK